MDKMKVMSIVKLELKANRKLSPVKAAEIAEKCACDVTEVTSLVKGAREELKQERKAEAAKKWDSEHCFFTYGGMKIAVNVNLLKTDKTEAVFFRNIDKNAILFVKKTADKSVTVNACANVVKANKKFNWQEKLVKGNFKRTAVAIQDCFKGLNYDDFLAIVSKMKGFKVYTEAKGALANIC
jgi:hypothetical protein